MQRNAFAAALILTAVAMSGCTDTPDATLTVETGGAPGEIIQDPITGEELFLEPRWEVGRWWQVHVAVDYDFGFIQDIDAKIVVTEAGPQGFRTGTDEEFLGVFDAYFDSFYLGRYDGDLNPSIQGATVKFFEWPLKANQTWTTELPRQGFEGFSGEKDAITFNVSVPEEQREWGPNLRIMGESAHGEIVDFNYAPETGWMTYFKMINTTTGRHVINLKVTDTGVDYYGPAHHVTTEGLHFGFKMTPPFNPSLAPVPPAETVTVGDGYDWVEEILFLFTFPMFNPVTGDDLVGGGEIVIVILHPDGTHTRETHTGNGAEQPTFLRNQVRENAAGDWRISILPAGTGGGFVGLFGFSDEILNL